MYKTYSTQLSKQSFSPLGKTSQLEFNESTVVVRIAFAVFDYAGLWIFLQ